MENHQCVCQTFNATHWRIYLYIHQCSYNWQHSPTLYEYCYFTNAPPARWSSQMEKYGRCITRHRRYYALDVADNNKSQITTIYNNQCIHHYRRLLRYTLFPFKIFLIISCIEKSTRTPQKFHSWNNCWYTNFMLIMFSLNKNLL